jgi:hypothetical protein
MLDIRELMNLKEAYNAVYAPQELTEEQVWEEVETIEEASDLEMGLGRKVLRDRATQAAKPTPVAASSRQLSAADRNRARMRPGRSSSKPQIGSLPPSARQVTQYPAGVPTGVGDGNAGASVQPAPRPDATAAPKPTATAAPRPTATAAAPKPAAAPAAKPAGSAMDQFAKANPKLAASAAERDRTRGTSATTNPLMKDMKSRLPAPKTPSPTTAKTGFDLAKKGVNLAAGFDMFDVVKGYLIGEGYADTEEAALAIMINMSEEWRQSIIKSI